MNEELMPDEAPAFDAAATVEAPDAPAPVADAAIVAAAEDTMPAPAAAAFEAIQEITHRSFGRSSAEEPMTVSTRIGGV